MKKTKMIICDLDGTLFDTLEVNYQAYKKSLNEMGYELSYSFFMKECYGKHYKEFLSKLNLTEEEIEKVHIIKKNIYRDNLKYAKINNYLFDIIESLKYNYYTVLVTTASKQNSEEILEFFNKKEVFELFIFAENVERKKPDPEGFIKAMEYFNISPENTLIFEDSDIGIEAAQRSGANIMRIEKF